MLGLLFSLPQVVVAVVVVIVVVVVVVPMLSYRSVPIYTDCRCFFFFWRVRRNVVVEPLFKLNHVLARD